MQRYKDLCMHSQLCMCWTMCLSLCRYHALLITVGFVLCISPLAVSLFWLFWLPCVSKWSLDYILKSVWKMINFLDVRFWEREVLLTIKRNTSKFYAWDRFQVESYTSTVIRETGTLWLCTAGPEDEELWEMRMERWLEPDHRTFDPRGSILFSMQWGPMKVDGNHFLLFQNKYFFLQNIGILFGYTCTHIHTHTQTPCVFV